MMHDYTHPDIERVERTGYLYGEPGNKRLGYCEQCGDSVMEEYSGDAYETDEGFIFCCMECCHEYYGIRRVDV